jgi:hypothetical protein
MLRLADYLGRITFPIALTVALFGFRPAVAQDAVLLASTVPGYVPGMVVSSADRLSVPEGASATLLFQTGETLRLRGPFEGSLGQQQSETGTGIAPRIADIFRMHGVDVTVIGGTRSTGSTRSEPELDDVDVDPDRSGTYCFQPATSVWILRPSTDGTAYTLRRKGSARTLQWPPDAQRIEWPADVPIEDGDQFEIAAGGIVRATETFRSVPSTAGNGPARIAGGLIRGCRDQFDTELRRFSRMVVTPEVRITTDRGRRPAYHPGEPIAVTVMASTDGFLYCMAIDETGGARPIFPAGAMEGAQVRGSMPLSIPGRRQPKALIATAGIQNIRCWLADRDISPDLPKQWLAGPPARLTELPGPGLDTVFGRIGGTHIETDALPVRVE